jgi:hypothetical protein
VHIGICAGGCNADDGPKDKQDVELFLAEALRQTTATDTLMLFLEEKPPGVERINRSLLSTGANPKGRSGHGNEGGSSSITAKKASLHEGVSRVDGRLSSFLFDRGD